jgi:penicillin amidase
MKKLSILFSLISIFAATLTWAADPGKPHFTNLSKSFKGGKTLEIPALTDKVCVTTDRNGVRHIKATNDFDLAIASGFVHCRDRLFQMDQTRRIVDGTEAELLGPGRLKADIQARIVGLHRAAERTFHTLPPRLRKLLEAYTEGVNHCIDTLPLPPEYGLLKLTQVRPWEAVDSVKISKAQAASLSLDIDTGLTEDLIAYATAGEIGGFDGQALFFYDVFRSAPMDGASTVPDATNDMFLAGRWKTDAAHPASNAKAARRVREKMATHPLFALAQNRRENPVASNEWGVTGSRTRGGRPIIANDPHLALNIPATFYEWHLVVTDDPNKGPLNVNGVGFPGLPGVILGQNERITWGATVNPMDVSDVFSDRLLVKQPGADAYIESPPGTFYPVEIESGVTYYVNVIVENGEDNLVEAMVPPEAKTIAWVNSPFRSFGPIIDIETPSVLVTGGTTTALVLQYTGFHATQELQAIQLLNRARNLGDFLKGLEKLDVGSQNWAYADVDGNLAYFTSAEMPLRTDLEAGYVEENVPPFFVRDGTSGNNNWIADPDKSQGQTIPFAILPFNEMPQTINPENDFFVNANNDPAGITLDNNPLNQFRTSNSKAIYYLNPGYADGLRAGRITQLIEDHYGKISFFDMMRFQSNTQQLDAELMTPFLLDAFKNARRPGAPTELADMAADRDIIEAVRRLARWNFSTPTGIPRGYDAKDFYGFRKPRVSIHEARASVAATIYNMWRGKSIRSIVDARLIQLGLGDNLPNSRDALKALYNLLSQNPYTGVAAAGVDWIPEPASLSAEERRDLALLQALRDALDSLASPEFAPAFGHSTNQNRYRWGKLHRIVFDHPFEDAFNIDKFNIPPQAGFKDLSSELPGLARDGGYEVVNRSGFSARAVSFDAFMFDRGSVRRYVGQTRRGSRKITGVNVVPGGPSGIPGDPNYATQLGTWLTADYHTVKMDLWFPKSQFIKKETFVPVP